MLAAHVVQTSRVHAVRLPAPLDIAGSLELFRRSGDDLLDRWDGQRLMRTLTVDGRVIPYVCRPSGTLDTPELTLEAPNPPAPVAGAVASTFFPAPASYL